MDSLCDNRDEPRRLRALRDDRRHGMTLLEVAVYFAILIIIGAPLMNAVLVSSRSVAEGHTFTHVSERNRVLLFRIAQDVRRSLQSSVVVSLDTRQLTLGLTLGVGSTGIILGDTVRYEIVLAPGETLNGVDDNGNGLADEGNLVLRNITTGTVVTLSAGINVATSSFNDNGGSVTINLTNFGRLPTGESFEHARSVTVFPRN